MIIALLLVIVGLMFPPALFVIVPGAVLYVGFRMFISVLKGLEKVFEPNRLEAKTETKSDT